MNHCGLFHTPFKEAYSLMPDLKNIFDSAPVIKNESYVVDVKIHMLMPNQWPCIPNWHYDHIPRDEELNQRFDLVEADKVMFMWVSGEPLPEFRNIGNQPFTKVPERTWFPFTQLDEHRGTMSKIHTWRTFIRLTPQSILRPAPTDKWIRRHVQVYLDINKFKW